MKSASSFILVLVFSIAATPGWSDRSAIAQEVDPIRAPMLADGWNTVKLPGKVTRTATGAGGRFIFLLMPDVQQIGVFDCNEAAISKYIPLASADAMFCAGASKLVLFYPDKRVLTRYSLVNFEQELTVQLDIDKPACMLMGNRSEGPVVIGVQGSRPGFGRNKELTGLSVIDLETLRVKPVRVKHEQNTQWPHMSFTEQMRSSVSADGTLCCFSVGNSDSLVLRIEGNELSVAGPKSHLHDSPVIAGAIDPAGQYVVSSTGVFSRQLEPVSSIERNVNWSELAIRVPDSTGSFYLSVPNVEQRRRRRNRPDEEPKEPLAGLFLSGKSSQLLPVDLENPREVWKRGEPWVDTVFCVTPAELLIQLNAGGDGLLVKQFNVMDELNRAGIDFLFINSNAPGEAKPGEKYSYTVNAESNAKEIEFALLSAPEGMEISPKGVVSWDVPAPYEYSQAVIILAARTGKGQEELQTFKINTGGSGGTAPDAPPANTAGIAVADFAELPKIESANLAEPGKVALPDVVESLCLGGGGRYIILNFKETGKLGVFDTTTGRIEGYIPFPRSGGHFAASANRLLTLSSEDGIITRWDLATRQRELTKAIDLDRQVSQMVMGHSSSGPALIWGGERFGQQGLRTIDLKTLDVSPIKVEGSGGHGIRGQLRISGNGNVFTSWGGGSPSGLLVYTNRGGSWQGKYEHDSVGALLPSVNGRHIFTNAGVFTNDLTRVVEQGALYSPAPHGDFYLKVSGGDYHNVRNKGAVTTTLYKLGETRPIVKLPIKPALHEQDGWGRSPLTMEQRLMLIPNAGMVVELGSGKRELILHPFDLDRALNESGVDFFFVSSTAPPTAKMDQPYKYSLEVKSKKGGVTYGLASSPPGMTLTESGEITWTVPDDFDLEKTTVIVNLSDDSGQQLIHTFAVHVPEVIAKREERKAAAAREREMLAVRERERMERERAEAAKLREAERAAMIARRDEANRLKRERTEALNAARAVWIEQERAAITGDDAAKPDNLRIMPPEQRVWTDSLGNRLNATYVQVFAGSILLELDNGSQITVDGSKMSDADKEYARNRMRKRLEFQSRMEDANRQRIERQGDAAQRQQMVQQSAGQLQRLALAMKVHRGAGGRLATVDKSSGIELLSWRVHILPYIGEAELYKEFKLDEPWFSEHNRALIEKMPAIFASPGSNAPAGRTVYVAAVAAGGRSTIDNVRGGDAADPWPLLLEISDPYAVTWTRPDELACSTDDEDAVQSWMGSRDDGMLTGNLNGSVTLTDSSNPPLIVLQSLGAPVGSIEREGASANPLRDIQRTTVIPAMSPVEMAEAIREMYEAGLKTSGDRTDDPFR